MDVINYWDFKDILAQSIRAKDQVKGALMDVKKHSYNLSFAIKCKDSD